MFKVRHDLAFLSSYGRPPRLQTTPSGLVVSLLGTTATMEPLLRSDQISTSAHRLPGAPEMSVGNDTYGITGIPTMVGGHAVVERAGLGANTKIVYPGSGREDV